MVDAFAQTISPATIFVKDGLITKIEKTNLPVDTKLSFIMPGFIDSHVHIESSMLVPTEFARLAVVHGTIATVSDPHEIANVCGMDGVQFMLDNAKQSPFHFYFGAPSCVPATLFETAGATLNSNDIKKLLAKPEIFYLSEMMNFPGVLHGDEEVLKKIAAAKLACKPVDGHAPGLSGDDAKKYIDAGISTDHECFNLEEAAWKLKCGMKIIIREGSAAKNFDALIPLLKGHPQQMMFCSDDKHPDSLVEGHINQLCKRAVAAGIPIFNVIAAACINPVAHYQLDIGLLRAGDAADFIVVEDLVEFDVFQTFIGGQLVAENKQTLLPSVHVEPINHFNCEPISVNDIVYPCSVQEKIPVIEAIDGELITNKLFFQPKVNDTKIVSDIENDILKIVVVNRYAKAPPAIAFIKNFGIVSGAIASSVAHDSHNIIAVGADDESIIQAINLIIKHKGGICCVDKNEEEILSLPIAGLMNSDDGYEVAAQYSKLDKKAKAMGSNLSAPFMTLS
ncbi:MAG: adenine deaminase, partial [Chitinophagaceae bacterium]